MKKTLFIAMLLCASLAQAEDKPTTIPQLDVARYMGTWHEMARLPMRFQNSCVRDVQALYTLNADNTITVQNSCRRKDGSLMSAEGLAQATDATGSKLKVTFLPKAIRWLPFSKAGYWVLRLDDSYQHALVGTPNRKYAWILSRSPQMDEATYQSYVATAKAQGYDVAKLIRNPQ